MELARISIDPTLLMYVAEALGRVPESLYDFQKVKNLSCGGRPVYQKLVDPFRDPLPERLELARGDFSVIGKMSRLKKLTLSAMEVNDFSFLKTCLALESLEISACGEIDCALLENLKGLKSLSLLHCSGLKHVEDILKLFRLKRLSLEGSNLSDASCFINCRIPEVRLPENCLKEKQTGRKPASKKKKGAARPVACVPFKAAKRENHPYTCSDLASPLWETYKGAYGNVADYIAILTGGRDEAPETFKLRRLDKAPKTSYEIAFDNLSENLYHQMSFYPASWLVLPYLARLMEDWEREEDLDWLLRGILTAGGCLATDVFGSRPEESSLYESYENAALQIRAVTVDFLHGHLDYIRELKDAWARELAIAVTAILGERRLAFMLFLSNLESCYIVCPSCENCDEEIEFGYFDPSERIEAAQPPAEAWDGESFTDVKLWLYNLFGLLEDAEGVERLAYLFGTYVCPECGEKTPVLKGMEEYYLGEG